MNDSLVTDELSRGQLFKISEVELSDYGYYLAYPDGALDDLGVRAFRDWILKEATSFKLS